MITNKKVLITGGGGFIGTSLAERLVEDNDVILLDLNFDHNAFAFSHLKKKKNITIIKADILDSQAFAKVAQDAQIVVHTAAMVGVQEVIHNALYTLDVNYIGTSNLLKTVSRSSRCERLIFFSTSEVFGSNAFRIAEDGNSVLSSVQDIRWCYCISKLAAEHLALSYFRQKGLPVVVLRPFNVFGPKRQGDHVVLRFILRALKNEKLEVYGDGTQIRAWCYIDDLCDALLACMVNERAVGQAFNIGNPRNTLTVYDLAKRIISLCGSKSNILFKALDFADIDIRVPNTSKARDILGFVPKIEIEEGLSRTIEWVKPRVDELSSLLNTTRREYIV
jgi:nucleoside-diphosphate-sugar epimerase